MTTLQNARQQAPEQYGPDRATYRHWLDRESKAVIGAAGVLREFHRTLGMPAAIIRRDNVRVYVWQHCFDRHIVSIFHN